MEHEEIEDNASKDFAHNWVFSEVMILVRSRADGSLTVALVFKACTHTFTFFLSSAAIFLARKFE